MQISNQKEPLLLFVGDMIVFAVSLWLMLAIRYFEIPGQELVVAHLRPFSFLFGVWALVFYAAGLYEKHTMFFRSKLSSTVLRAQLINTSAALLFFYSIPYLGITPKTNLFIYLVISFGLIMLWRTTALRILASRKREKALLIGSGEEMKELYEEVNRNSRYSLQFVSVIDLSLIPADTDFHTELMNSIYSERISVIVVDTHHERTKVALPHLYNLMFSGIRFVDMYQAYEEIFDRVPLSLLSYDWFIENLSLRPQRIYDIVKRTMDIVLALILGALSLVVYPFVWITTKLDSGGRIFFTQDRLGQNNRVVRIYKFRSMAPRQKEGESEKELVVTRVGSFLRRTRIDELPQLWNVLRGDLSLIGPRPETPSHAHIYEEEVPYYSVRHLIKPGLSGWAQLHQTLPPKFAPESQATRIKLSYDLYYLKNRSIFLDFKIALQTLKTLLSRSGI